MKDINENDNQFGHFKLVGMSDEEHEAIRADLILRDELNRTKESVLIDLKTSKNPS